MKKIVFMLIFSLLSGCATVGKEQSICERQYFDFASIVKCTEDSFAAARPNALENPRIKLYFLKGDELVEEINKGKISDLDAKTEWQTLYVNLKTQENAEINAGIANYNANRPRQTNCYTAGSSTNCTTY